MTEATTTGDDWFYTAGGQRKGPVTAKELSELFGKQTIDGETPVWRKGQGDWLPLRKTDLSAIIKDEPPPVASEHINNTLIWIVALAPIAYGFFQACIAGYEAQTAGQDHSISSILSFLVPITVNAALCLRDERQLNKAGYASGWMTFFAVVLVPVYLFMRAKRLRQTPTYGFVWIVSFILSLMILGSVVQN